MRHTLEPATAAAPTPDCLDDDLIASLVDGTIDPAQRAATLPHLASCARCRGAVASIARTVSNPDVVRARRSAFETWRPVVYRIALPIAAAVIVVVLVRPGRDQEAADRHRAPTIEAAPAPRAVFPVETVDSVPELRWTSVAGADRYRVSLFDAGGQVLYERQMADTFAILPDSIAMRSGTLYLWKVEARTGFDRWTASVLQRFTLRAFPPR
jgi:hypothetical protein